MKVLILYRPNSEHGRVVETFINDYRSQHGFAKLEVLNVDTRDGNAAASLYDIVQYPAILALRNDGALLRSWEGSTLPLMNDVAYYSYNQE